MNTNTYKYSLFEVTGLELEYMIVDMETLNIKPVSDMVLQDALGHINNEIEHTRDYGSFSWSNELIAHVMEIKVSTPVRKLSGLDNYFHREILEVNKKLREFNSILMPTAMHPWMNPIQEAVLWKHEYSEVYNCFNHIFNCKTHGWANLQSVHINLPFKNNDEFVKLHTAARVVLPLIPAIAASSPIVEGRSTGILDNRLIYYKDNSKLIPSITGKVVPDVFNSMEDYKVNVLNKIYNDLQTYDYNKILCNDWVNSRGALPNFERGSVEIRVIDIQECPKMDMAVSELIVNLVKALVKQKWFSFDEISRITTNQLYDIFIDIIKSGENAIIRDKLFLSIFGITKDTISAIELWNEIYAKISNEYVFYYNNEIELLLEKGCLATRILQKLNNDVSNIKEIYQNMIYCLNHNLYFS